MKCLCRKVSDFKALSKRDLRIPRLDNEASPLSKERIEEGKRNVDEINKISKEIRVLQENCEDYVVPLDIETIEDLLKRNLLYTKKSKEGKIVTTVYRMPLNKDLEDNDPNQINKLGGLAVLDRKFSTLKILKQMMDEIHNEFTEKNMSVVMCSANKAIQKLLNNNFKMIELTSETFNNKFPDFYAHFMDSETKKYFGDSDRIYIQFKKEKELNKILDGKLAA
jgi:hypothetical protein